MTDSGARAILSDWKGPIVAVKSIADNGRECLWNKADGIFGKASGQRIGGALPACMVIAAVYDA